MVKYRHVAIAPKLEPIALTLTRARLLVACLERMVSSPWSFMLWLTQASSQVNAVARIQWLEDLIKSRLPDVDLACGPSVSLPGPVSGSAKGDPSHAASEDGRSNKRQRGPDQEHDLDATAAMRARFMAMQLGLFSLNGNASRLHYVGSSSGSFFASMLQANHAAGDESHHDEAQGLEPDSTALNNLDGDCPGSCSHALTPDLAAVFASLRTVSLEKTQEALALQV